ncbi:SH3 and PX domain-containing 2A-like isoform X2 [Labeo rohita]|uniref:SH3 and PX domain-containing 2A-like isoform X2 n=1 Tax=Labeo rohita TaxID=84645 RepID=A0A498P249_LABRO|nr:SH3 and PX domain-containing 2A-like isoform X2 [Labeo rohita]
MYHACVLLQKGSEALRGDGRAHMSLVVGWTPGPRAGRECGDALGAEECMCVYVVTADYQRQENTEISLRAGERVEVIEKSESGWWFVRTAEEQGWVPATYLVSLTGRRDSHKAPNGETERYITVQSFNSSSQDELGFESGVIVEVIQRNLEGWWFIRYGGKEGWAPAAYLKKMQDGVMAGSPSNNQKPPPRRENSLVIEKNSGGWWYVQIGEKEGWAPCSYIDKRKKPTLYRQTSTLTRPKVPPPAPPIKKQNSLPCVESEIVTQMSPRVYEEPEYDVPTVGLEFDPEQDFLPGDAPNRAPPPLNQRTVSFTLGEGDEEDDEGVYANGGFRAVPQCKDSHSDTYSSSAAQRASMWDPPEYDAPTVEPNIELYAHSKQSKLKQQADESKSKPSVRPKPANQDCSSLRRPLNQEQPGQMQFRTSRTSEDSENSLSEYFQAFSDLPSFFYRTTASYQREEPCELSFPAGVQVEVLEKQESGWWFVRWGNEEGWAPTYYLQPIKSSETSSTEAKTSEKINSETSWSALPELEISVQGDVGKMGRCVSLEKNEQRVNQSLKSGHRSNQQNCRVGVKQLAVRPQNVLKDNTNTHTTPAGRRNDALPGHSYNDQTTCAGNTESMRHKVPVSMVKPKPHLIHNNLREEYVSIADYHGDAETMSFPAGTRLEVLERNPNGWWYCRVLDSAKTRKGWVPSNFLERRS